MTQPQEKAFPLHRVGFARLSDWAAHVRPDLPVCVLGDFSVESHDGSGQIQNRRYSVLCAQAQGDHLFYFQAHGPVVQYCFDSPFGEEQKRWANVCPRFEALVREVVAKAIPCAHIIPARYNMPRNESPLVGIVPEIGWDKTTFDFYLKPDNATV